MVGGAKIVVKATITNECLTGEDEPREPFEYQEGELGVMVWIWDRATDPNPEEIRVIWDKDPKRIPRKIMLDNVTPVGLQDEVGPEEVECRIMVSF